MQVPIRVVIFDLGRVMIRLAEGWEGACRESGVPYYPFTPSPAFTAGYLELLREYERGMIPPDSFFASLQQLFDGIYTLREVRTVYQTTIREEFPGIPEIVRAIKAAGYRTACLSNTCASHWVELTNPERYPGIGLLDMHFGSHLLGAVKPDAVVFRMVEELVAAEPREILFFDDTEVNTAAACACGWNAVRITPDRPAPAQICEALTDFCGLPVACG